jgi:hypothetical protein
LQEGELLEVDISHLVEQALKVYLGRVPGLARILKLTLHNGNLSSKFIGFSMHKGQ